MVFDKTVSQILIIKNLILPATNNRTGKGYYMNWTTSKHENARMLDANSTI